MSTEPGLTTGTSRRQGSLPLAFGSGAAIGVLGAVAGAVVGNVIERSATREESLEIMVQLRNGERRAIVQAKGRELQPG